MKPTRPPPTPRVARLPLDMIRMQRAIWLSVEALGTGNWHFRVTGGKEPHYVDLRAQDEPGAPYYWTCDCGDNENRGTACKHMLAALLKVGDPDALRLMFACARRRREGADASPEATAGRTRR